MRKIIVLLLILLAYLPSSGNSINQVRVDARFDSTKILIGDQIYLTIEAEHPRDIKVVFPNFKDSLISKLEIIQTFKIDTTILPNGNYKISQRYLVTSFDSGEYVFGPVKFTCISNDETDTIISNPISLTVLTIPIKDFTKIADIKKIINLPLTLKELMPLIGICLIILVLLALAAYIYIRWKNKKPIFGFMEKPAEPAHVIAFRELEKIKSEKLWQKGKYKDYYSRITDAIRRYIETRFEFTAMESTTEEIYNNLKEIDSLKPEWINELKEMLSLADLVKFARAEPLPDENENAWQVAYKFIENTYVRPVTNTESANSLD